MTVEAGLERPASVDELGELVRQTAGTGTALRWAGGGTHAGYGNHCGPVRWVDLRGLAGIIEYVPDDMTITVRAGTTVGELIAAVEAHGQRCGFDVADRAATVGGTLAVAGWGPRLAGWGRLRDRVVGLQVVDGRGVAVRSGGRVVKNVSGFDVHKLHLGAHGSLGAITEVSLKLSPRPSNRTGAQTHPAPLERLRRLVDRNAVSCALWRSEDAWRLVVEWEGSVAGVATRRSSFAAQALAEGVQLDAGTPDWSASWPVAGHWWVDVLSDATSVERLASRLPEAVGAAWLWPVAGTARLRLDVDPVATIDGLRSLVEPAGRVVVASRGGDGAVDGWGLRPEPWALHREIKASWDPHGMLAPGCSWGGL